MKPTCKAIQRIEYPQGYYQEFQCQLGEKHRGRSHQHREGNVTRIW